MSDCSALLRLVLTPWSKGIKREAIFWTFIVDFIADYLDRCAYRQPSTRMPPSYSVDVRRQLSNPASPGPWPLAPGVC